jgi:hypothetical protein
MNEGIFTIELGRYGFMLDTEWAYVSLSWELLFTGTLVAIIAKAYKNYSKKVGK